MESTRKIRHSRVAYISNSNNTAFTSVEVSVSSTDLLYAFAHRKLVSTYLLAFCILTLISAAGMLCLLSNGQPSSNNFSHLLIATRNPKLDTVAKKMITDPSWSAQARLRFGGVAMPDGEVTVVFSLSFEQEFQSLRKHH
jgi:predicted permease